MLCLQPLRLFKRSYLGIIHFSLLLVLFGAAASKAQHTPLLSAMLLSELPSTFYIAGRLQARRPLVLPHLPSLCRDQTLHKQDSPLQGTGNSWDVASGISQVLFLELALATCRKKSERNEWR